MKKRQPRIKNIRDFFQRLPARDEYYFFSKRKAQERSQLERKRYRCNQAKSL